MSDLRQFKKDIYLYALLSAIFFEIISIPVFGAGIDFAYGLCLGTAAAMANFSIMAFVFGKMFDTGKAAISILGYAIRLALFAGVFLAALQISKVSALGALAGLFTVKLSIYYVHGIKQRIKGRKNLPKNKA